jgi:hypothetical protein
MPSQSRQAASLFGSFIIALALAWGIAQTLSARL